jgi:hypothetical protein
MKELIEILRHLNFTTTNSEGKEVVFLPTLSEFILANDLSPIRLGGGYDRVMLYTKFLTQPITLSMLGTGMSEPALFSYWSSEKHGHGMSIEDTDECILYQQLLDTVIFDSDFFVENGVLWIGEINIDSDTFMIDYSTIEDIVNAGYRLVLKTT